MTNLNVILFGALTGALIYGAPWHGALIGAVTAVISCICV